MSGWPGIQLLDGEAQHVDGPLGLGSARRQARLVQHCGLLFACSGVPVINQLVVAVVLAVQVAAEALGALAANVRHGPLADFEEWPSDESAK
eukprot:4553918-Pyramimonas_sp.AAC.1